MDSKADKLQNLYTKRFGNIDICKNVAIEFAEIYAEDVCKERDALIEEVERLRKLIQPTSSGTREGDGC